MKRFRSILFLLATALLFGAASAQAYLVAVEVLWTEAQLSSAHLGQDSIIQLVAFNQSASTWNYATAVNTPGENFAHYSGDGVAPYDDDVYIPDTTPDAHHIVGSGNIQKLEEYGDNPVFYGMTTIIDVPDSYDSLYVRVFSATGFEQGVVSSDINWGISAVTPISNKWGTGLAWFDNVEAPNVANFELIPEPSSLAFLLSGGCGMGVFSLFRRRRKLRPPEE
jgi:hypothetical protein